MGPLRVEGWLADDEHPDRRLALDILLGDRMIGRVLADRPRADLKDAGIGDGQCAFSFEMPPLSGDRALDEIRVRLADSNLFLGNPRQAAPGAEPATTRSSFGGLWIDRTDFLDRIGAKHRAGAMSDARATQIFEFARDGFTIIRQAVDRALVDRVRRDIEQFWHMPPAGLLVETFEPDGVLRNVSPDIRWRKGRTKMLDLFAHSTAAREAIAAPKVIDFLTDLFEDCPQAFQSPNHHSGIERAMHKDTAYVKVDGNPLAMAASWIALEDIEEGTGEVEYLVGSHRAPDFRFGGISKWMEARPDDHAAFLASVRDHAAEYGHTVGRFTARRGDVLLWHADLAHGDAPVRKPGKTRQGLVTHFCPARYQPFYRRTSSHSPVTEFGCTFVSEYGPVAAMAAAA